PFLCSSGCQPGTHSLGVRITTKVNFVAGCHFPSAKKARLSKAKAGLCAACYDGAMHEPIAYLDHRLVPVSEARLHVFDLGIVGGMAVTEMIRTFRHRPFRLSEHLMRLEQSCRRVGFEMPKPLSELASLAEEIVAHNVRLIADEDDLGLI